MTRSAAVGAAIVVALAAAVGAAGSAPAAAQTADRLAAAVKLPEPLTREAIRELVARLSDAEVRQLLLAQLDKAAAPAPADHSSMAMAPMVGGMDAHADRLRGALRTTVMATARLPQALPAALAPLTASRGLADHLQVLLGGLAMLAGGWLAERLFGRVVSDMRRRPGEWGSHHFASQAGRFLLRAVLDGLGLLAFALGALAAFIAVHPRHGPTRQLLLTLLAATVLVRVVGVIARLLLEPGVPAARLLPLDDATARRLHAGVIGLAAVYAAGDMGLGLLEGWGLPGDVGLLLSAVAGLVFLGLLLGLIWANRPAMASLVRGPEPAGHVRRLAAETWPLLASAYVVLVFLAWSVEHLSGMALRSRAGIGSLLVIVVLPLADMLLCRLVRVLVGSPDAGAPDAAAASFEPVLRRGIHIAVTVAGLLVIARLWGLDLFDLTARSMGARLSEALLSVAITLLVAYLAWETVKAFVDRQLAREAGPEAPEPGEGGGKGASRLRTILPLVRGFLFVAICTMTVMIVLAGLGVNIGPLLAGAGVVGLALGFGAQTLVRDVVSGLFFLIDDAFRLGEYIDVGDVKGTVERIGLRSMQLRHHRGALNTVPYGSIRRLINESRDWVIVKLEFRLTYDTDLVKVKKILKRVGEELQQDPELGPGLLQPLKSQGVTATEDSALVVRAKFMARPDDVQYVIRREAYNRILKAFAENGIRFAHRQVTVLAPPAAGQPAGAAAAAALGDGPRP